MATKFIGIDGEAIEEKYSLLQASDGSEILNRRGLGSLECLRYLWSLIHRSKGKNKKAVLVWFGGHYDVNMILKDLPQQNLEDLFIYAGETEWQGYSIRDCSGGMWRLMSMVVTYS